MHKTSLGVSYYGNRIPWRVKDDLAAIREAGCTTVVHTFSEEDHQFYQPAMEQITADSNAYPRNSPKVTEGAEVPPLI